MKRRKRLPVQLKSRWSVTMPIRNHARLRDRCGRKYRGFSDWGSPKTGIRNGSRRAAQSGVITLPRLEP